MQKMTVYDIDIKGKKLIIRVDFNVPLDEAFHITDDRRIKAALPTIKYVMNNGASKVILMSHLGRPKGAGFEKEFSLAPVAQHLQELLVLIAVYDVHQAYLVLFDVVRDLSMT